MSSAEGVDAFCRLISGFRGPHVIVTPKGVWAALEYARGMTRANIFNAMARPQSSATFRARPNLRNPYVAPTNEAEQDLADIWKELLGVEEVGINDNFFDLGGHSLVAIQLIGKIQSRFQVDLPLGQFFENPTIEGSANILLRLHREQEDGEKLQILSMLRELSEDEIEAEIARRASPQEIP